MGHRPGSRSLLVLIGLLALGGALLLATAQRDDTRTGRERAAGWQMLPTVPGAREAGLSSIEAVKVGSRLLIVAGASYEQNRMHAIDYSVGRARWGALTRVPLHWRVGYSLVAAGREAILWGGTTDTGSLGDGVRRVVGERDWRWTAPSPLRPRASHTAIWTGSRMLVWGGAADGGGRRRWGGNTGSDGPHTLLGDGASYHPASGRWRMLAPAPLDARQSHVAVWTGSRMLVWGGETADRPGFTDDGAVYDPASDSWRPIRRAPIPSSPDAQAVWTGTSMLVWNGAEGASYHPPTDRWERLPPVPPGRTMGAAATWSGEELIVWGGVRGICGDCYAKDRAGRPAEASDGVAYEPAESRWRVLPPSPLAPRDRHALVGLGAGRVLAWGGCCAGSRQRADGAVYRPAPLRAARVGRDLAAPCRAIEAAMEARCPSWLPAPGSRDDRPAFHATKADFDGGDCGYLTQLHVRSGAGPGYPYHLWFGGRCRPFDLRVEGGRWPRSPRRAGYLGLVVPAPERPGDRGSPPLVRPRVLRTADVRGHRALLLAVEPFPRGGLHGGHYAVVWNEGGAGYALSFHVPGGDERRPPLPRHERALLRAAASMKPAEEL